MDSEDSPNTQNRTKICLHKIAGLSTTLHPWGDVVSIYLLTGAVSVSVSMLTHGLLASTSSY